MNIKYLMTLNSRESVNEPMGDLIAADLKSLFTHIDSINTITGNDPLPLNVTGQFNEFPIQDY